MGITFIRTIILYAAVIAAMRIMGKRTIGELSTTELVVSIMISDLASVPMQSRETPIIDGLVPIFTLVVLELVIAFVTLKSKAAKKLFEGQSRYVVMDGRFSERELERLRITIDDVESEIRRAGYRGVCDVKEVIVETDGQVTVMPKDDVRPATCGDLGIEPKKRDEVCLVIDDGKVDKKKLAQAKVSEEDLKRELRLRRVKDPSEVFYMSMSGGKTVLFQKKEGRN